MSKYFNDDEMASIAEQLAMRALGEDEFSKLTFETIEEGVVAIRYPEGAEGKALQAKIYKYIGETHGESYLPEKRNKKRLLN